MHAEAWNFLHETLTSDITANAHILEIGSYDVNGSARIFCTNAERYVGIDRRKGPGVDHVDAKDAYDGKQGFDIVITTETLEHASNPEAVIATAKRALKPGGLLVITAAGPGRKPHSSDGGPYEPSEGETYQNITKKALEGWLSDFERVTVAYGASHGHDHGDIYATAYKALEQPEIATDDEAEKPAKRSAQKNEATDDSAKDEAKE